MALAQRLDELAGAIEAQDLMGIAVGDENAVVRGGIDVVRLGQHALAPRAAEAPRAIEHQDGLVGAALGDMHLAVGVDHQIGNETEAPALGQLRPFAMHGVAPVAQDDGVAFVGHANS